MWISTYQSPQIIPDFRNVRIQTDSTRVGVQRIAVLVDLIVEHTNGAPEGWVPSITIDGLLVSFVGLGVFGLRHVATAKQIPTLRVGVVCADRLLEIFDRLFLAREAGALLVEKPAKLLQDLGMVGVAVENPSVGCLCRVELCIVRGNFAKDDGYDLHPSVAHERGRSGTRCLPQ